ncbi:hypothetical protein EVAR_102400_1, partial [Eumeta japonica]
GFKERRLRASAEARPTSRAGHPHHLLRKDSQLGECSM